MFVLGCHRSGTSLLAGIISDSLAEKTNSKPLEQLSAEVDNPGGFYESRQLVDLNETLLNELGVDWQHPPLHAIQWQRSEFLPRLHAARRSFTQQALSEAWVDKDPRLCLTYPAYQHVLLKRIPIAAVIRHPYEVAVSLQTRDMIPFAKGLIIWFLYNQHLSRSLTQKDVLISYQSLVNCEESAISALSTFISNNISQFNCTTELVRANLSRKAQPDWRRSNNEIPKNLLPEIEWTEIAQICIKIYEEIANSNFNIAQMQSSFCGTPDVILRGCATLGWQKMPEMKHDLISEIAAIRSELELLKNSKAGN